MPIFKSPTPEMPGLKAKHSASREGATISLLSEVTRRVEPFIRLLQPFRIERIIAADGRIFDVLSIPTGSSDVVLPPFFVEIRRTEAGGFEYRVAEGLLLTELSIDSAIEITGIAEWQSFSTEIKVFIEGTVSSFIVTEAAINSTSSAWPDPVEFDASPPTTQIKFNRPIAEIVASGSGYVVNPRITTTHLMINSICYDSFGSLFPLPY